MKIIDLEGVLTMIDTPEFSVSGFADVIQNFVAQLQEYSLHERGISQRIRILNLARVQLLSAKPALSLDAEKNRFILSLVDGIVAMIDCELRLVQMELDYPERFAESNDDFSGVKVFWSEKYTVTDLMELIVALHESGVLVYRDGSRVSLTALVRLFERMFNVKIKDVRGFKRNVTTRKIKTISFLKVLTDNFNRLCGR